MTTGLQKRLEIEPRKNLALIEVASDALHHDYLFLSVIVF